MRRAAGYRCTGCGALAAKWAGRCATCQEWNTLEVQTLAGGPRGPSLPVADPVRASDPVGASADATPTGLAEFDRVLSGGLGAGSVTLVGGEPGIGKSTLLLQVLAAAVARGARALYVSGEESVAQVRGRAERLGALHDDLWLLAASDVATIEGAASQLRPDIVVVDSIQMVRALPEGGSVGTVSQVRDAAARLAELAKASGITVVVVGHVTKDGALAGPRQLEHLVDTVLSFEGDRHHALRVLRATKHRFGPTNEVGLFEMTDAGLVAVADGSGLFLADRRPGAPGSVVFPLLEGQRPMLVELQALVVPSSAPVPRRSAQGLSNGRLALLLAVLGRRVGLGVLSSEVYALAVGGVEVHEPGADLAVALAVASSISGVAVPDDVVVCGEVGLGGEVRAVRNVERRLAEARRAGFGRAIVPVSALPARGAAVGAAGREGAEVLGVGTVSEALWALGIVDSPTVGKSARRRAA